MYKFKTLIILITATVLIFFMSPSLSQAQKHKPKHAPNALPGVEPGMLSPEYWTALQEDADEVIMTPEEIERFNEKIRNKKVVFREHFGKSDPLEKGFTLSLIKGHIMNPLLPLDLPDTLPGDSLRVRLKRNIKSLFDPEPYYGSLDFFDGRNAIYTDSMKQEIVDDMNIPGIPDVIKRRFGIVVNHVNMRFYPTSVPGNSDIEWELDRFQATGLLIGNPVAVLHESSDGDFLYVESPIARSWILARDIAIADREEVRKLTGDKNFLMAAGDKIPVYGDPLFKNFARYFYFSATMPLIGHNSRGYVVKMPYRRPGGSLGVAKGYIKPDADVHTGYFPYTKRNVINQFFKLLNTPYGSHDRNDKRSCSGTMRVLLRCFGIITGRTPSFILSSSDRQFYMNPGLSTEEKLKQAGELEPIITMAGTPGHIVLFLGRAHNGRLYFMHMAGWGYEDENGEHLIVNRVSLNEATHSWYRISQPRVFTTFR